MQELEERAAWDGKIFVDGGFRAPVGGDTLTVLDKAAGEPIGAVGVASTADLDAAVTAAKAAQRGRGAPGARRRGRRDDRARDRVDPRQGRLRGRRRGERAVRGGRAHVAG